MADAAAVTEVMAAQELARHRRGRSSRRPTSSPTGSDRGTTSPRSTRRRLRRRPPGGVRRGHWSPTAATRPSTPTTAAAASAPSWRGWMQEKAREPRRRPWSGCRSRRARPATGCWRRSATTSAGPAGCCSCPRARRSRARAARGLRRPRGRPEAEYEAAWTVARGRVPRVVGARARHVRGLPGLDGARPGFEPWNLRRGHRPGRRAWWPRHCRRSTTTARYVARLATRKDQRGRGSPRRCWSTRSRVAARARRHPVRALHRLAHRRPGALREGRHEGHVDLGQPGDRPLVRRRRRAGSAAGAGRAGSRQPPPPSPRGCSRG